MWANCHVGQEILALTGGGKTREYTERRPDGSTVTYTIDIEEEEYEVIAQKSGILRTFCRKRWRWRSRRPGPWRRWNTRWILVREEVAPWRSFEREKEEEVAEEERWSPEAQEGGAWRLIAKEERWWLPEARPPFLEEETKERRQKYQKVDHQRWVLHGSKRCWVFTIWSNPHYIKAVRWTLNLKSGETDEIFWCGLTGSSASKNDNSSIAWNMLLLCSNVVDDKEGDFGRSSSPRSTLTFLAAALTWVSEIPSNKRISNPQSCVIKVSEPEYFTQAYLI